MIRLSILRIWAVLKTSVASMTSTDMITSLASMTSTASVASKNKKKQLALYILSDYLAWETLVASMTSTASTTSVVSMTPTASFHQKIFNLKKNIYFRWFVILYYLKKAPKSQNNSNFIKEQRVLTNWTIEGTQHQKNKKMVK